MRELVVPRRHIVPPRPEVSSILAASLLAVLVFILVNDVAATTIAWILGFLFSLPFAILVREMVFLSGTGPVDVERASRVHQWASIAAKLLNFKGLAIFYTTRTRVGFQLVGLGSFRQEALQPKITFMVHKAAWIGGPVAEFDKATNQVYMVLPALVLEKAASLVREEGLKILVKLESLKDAKIVYSMLRSLALAAYGSKRVSAYIATKLFSRLVMEGYVSIDSEALLETISSRMPFEDPLTRRAVKKQLLLELMETLT